MQCMTKYHICYGFWYILENSRKWAQKSYFWGFFQRFLGHTLPPPLCHSQIICQMEGLMKIHNPSKFHLDSIFGSQVIKFKCFRGNGAAMKNWAIFGGFWTLTRPKTFNFAETCTRASSWGEKSCGKISLRNSNFYWNYTLAKFKSIFCFCPTLGPIYPMKEAEIGKTKISAR